MNIFDEAHRAFLRTGQVAGLIEDIAVSPDGATVLSRGTDGMVCCQDAATGRTRWAHTWLTRNHYWHHGFNISCFLDDRHAVLGGIEVLRIVRVADGVVVREHPVCILNSTKVTRGGGLLCTPGWRLGFLDLTRGGRRVVIDPWTLEVRIRFGTRSGPDRLVYAGGDMAFLGKRILPGCDRRVGFGAWHVAGPRAGQRAWQRRGGWLGASCVTGIDRVALWFDTGISEIDLRDGRELAQWAAPMDDWRAGTQHLRVIDGRVHRSREREQTWEWVAVDDGTVRNHFHAGHMGFDPWRRDHADQRPADVRPRGIYDEMWQRPGPDMQPIAVTAGDDGLVAVVSADGSLARWDVARRRLIERTRLAPAPMEPDRQAVVAQGDPGGRWMTWADGTGTVHRIDIANGRTSPGITTHIAGFTMLAVSEDGFVAGPGSDDDGMQVMQCYDWNGAQRWVTGLTGLRSVAAAGAGRFAFLVGDAVQVVAADGTDIGAPMVPDPLEPHYECCSRSAYRSIAMRDGRVVANGWDGRWTATGSVAADHLPETLRSSVAIAIAAGGNTVIVAEAYRTEIVILDQMGKRERSLIGHLGAVTALALTPDGTRLVSAGTDGYVIVWDTATWKRVAQAALLPTEMGAEQGWWMVGADGVMNSSAGFVEWVNPCEGE
jgi:hypothetical protein